MPSGTREIDFELSEKVASVTCTHDNRSDNAFGRHEYRYKVTYGDGRFDFIWNPSNKKEPVIGDTKSFVYENYEIEI